MLVVVDARRIEDYGIGTYVRGLLRAMTRRETTWTFVLLGKPGGERPVGGPNVRWEDEPSPGYGVRELVALPRRVRALGADLFHAPHYVLPPSMPCPCVVTVHDDLHLRFPEHLPRPRTVARAYAAVGLRHALRAAAAAITVSESARRGLVETLGPVAERLLVIPHGVDEDIARPVGEAELERVRARYGLDLPCVLFAGNTKRHKGLDVLVRAYDALVARRADVDLVLVGGDVGADVARRPGVRTPGFVDRRDLAALYRLARVVAVPSLYEGFGLTALEAMACGTPVVVSDGGALPEVVGDAGRVVPVGDAVALAAALEEVLGEPALAASLAARGLARAAQFTWDDAARRTADVYRRALDASARCTA